MKIVIDSREQRPFDFQPFGAETIISTLPSGDYSIAGMETYVSVERKELSDLLNCLGSERPRFFRELERLRSYEAAAIVIESPLSAIAAGHYRSRISPQSAIQSLIAIQAQFRLPVFFAKDRTEAEMYVFHFLRHFQNMIERRYAACCTEAREKTISNKKMRKKAQKGA